MRNLTNFSRRNLALALLVAVIALVVGLVSFGPGNILVDAQRLVESGTPGGANGVKDRTLLLPAAQQQSVSSPHAVTGTKNWSGGDNNDSNWTSNGNWAGIIGAGQNDDLIFPQSAARKTNTNDFGANTNFASLTFDGTGYVIGGSQIILASGISGSAPSGTSTVFNPNIVLGADQTFANTGQQYILNGVVNLNAHTLTLNPTSGSSIVMNGTISGGTGSVIKNGAGFVTLTGNSPSVGTIEIHSGTLTVAPTAVVGTVDVFSGTLQGTGTVGSLDANTLAPNNGIVAPGIGAGNAGILNAGFTEFAATGTFAVDLNGTTVGSQYDRLNTSSFVKLNGVNLSLTLGFTPAVGTTFTIIQSTGAISGQFAQGNSITVNGRTFSITYNTNSVVLTAVPGTFTWDGGGVNNNWTTAANWVGDIAPLAGDNLVFPEGAASKTVSNDFPAGTNFNSLTFTGSDYLILGNALTLNAGITANVPTGARPIFNSAVGITLTAPQTFLNSSAVSGAIRIDGLVNLNGHTLTADGVGNVNLLGQVTGSGGIVKNGAGTLFLEGPTNNYTGLTQINAGTVQLFTSNALGASGAGNDTVVAAGATLQFGFPNITSPESLTINGSGPTGSEGAIFVNSAGETLTGSITLGNTVVINCSQTNTLTISGVIGEPTPNHPLTKVGTGTLILNATNTYTGSTQINAGTLLVNGTIPGLVPNNGGTLGGSGTVGQITGNGTIAPGSSPGILNANGNVVFGATTTLNIEIGGTTAGTQYDRLNVIGTINLGLGVNNLSGTLVNGFVPATGAQFTIIQSTGQVSNTFAQGNSVTFSGRQFSITYNSNSVVLTALTPTSTWDGGGADNNWTTAANWVGDVAPSAGDSLGIL